MMKFWKILNNTILAIIIIFSLLIIFSSLGFGGNRIFVVKSGSMEPKIHTGSLVLDIAAANYKVGDIVTFKISGSKDTVTHRIVEIQGNGGREFYKVKGDANNEPDPNFVLKSNVVGRVRFSIPYAGYLITFIKTLPGLIIFIIIPATIIAYQEVINIKSEIQKLREARRKLQEIAGKMEADAVAEERKLAGRLKGLLKKLNKEKMGKISKMSKGARNESDN